MLDLNDLKATIDNLIAQGKGDMKVYISYEKKKDTITRYANSVRTEYVPYDETSGQEIFILGGI